MVKAETSRKNAVAKKSNIFGSLIKYRQLYILLLPGLLHYILFRYVPLGGIVVAFKNYNIYRGILNSPWVGFEFFKRFMTSPDFPLLIKNTFLLGVYSTLWSFPFPIIFAIFLNELKQRKFQRVVQSVAYLPSLLSVVVVCSMVIDLLSPTSGSINKILQHMGFQSHYFMTDPKWFRTIYISSGIWQNMGYGAIIYIAALTNIDSQLYEATAIDGGGRFSCIWHVTLPGLLPTICTMFILNAGQIFKIGVDKILLLYNPLTYPVADIFGSFVYRTGLLESNYSYAAAAGLFESVVAFIFVLTANKLSKKFTDTALW